MTPRDAFYQSIDWLKIPAHIATEAGYRYEEELGMQCGGAEPSKEQKAKAGEIALHWAVGEMQAWQNRSKR